MKNNKNRALQITLTGIVILALSIYSYSTAEGFDGFGAAFFGYFVAPPIILFGLYMGFRSRKDNSKLQNYFLIGTVVVLLVCGGLYTVSRKRQAARYDYCDKKYPHSASDIVGDKEARKKNISCNEYVID